MFPLNKRLSMYSREGGQIAPMAPGYRRPCSDSWLTDLSGGGNGTPVAWFEIQTTLSDAFKYGVGVITTSCGVGRGAESKNFVKLEPVCCKKPQKIVPGQLVVFRIRALCGGSEWYQTDPRWSWEKLPTCLESIWNPSGRFFRGSLLLKPV